MGQPTIRRSKWIQILFLQSMVFLYSLVSLLSKFAATFMREGGFWNARFLATVALMLLCLAVYAVFWQRILKIMDLSLAYLNKGTGLLWSLLWSVLIFAEGVTWQNIVGVALIISGMTILNMENLKTVEGADSHA